jgi:hypothetical protein
MPPTAKHIFATGRYAQGLWHIETGAGAMTTYVVQVMDGGRAKPLLTTQSRYEAMAVYNGLAALPKWVLEVHESGGRVVRSSDDDGQFAAFAANNQKEIAE